MVLSVTSENTTENCSTFNLIAESAARIAIHNFRWQYASLILYNTTLLCGVDTFLQAYQKTVITGLSTFNPWFIEHTSQFVLFLDNIDQLIYLLEWLKTQRFNNTGYYLIVCNSAEERKCCENRAIDLFWKYQIANIVYIKYDRTQEAIGYTYYHDENCRNSSPQKLDKWDSCFKHNNETNCAEMFPIKFKNFHKCPLIVSTFEQKPYMMIKDGAISGADGDLLRIIIDALNATLIIMTPRLGNGWGKFEENGTWTGSLGDVYYNWANFSMTSASITLRRFSYFQMSTNYNLVTLAWVTHPSSFEPSSFKLLRPYSIESQIILLILLMLIFILSLFFRTNLWKTIKRRLNLFEVPGSILFHSWEICMGLPVTRLPTKWFLSYFTLLWIWYCFFLRTLYQVYLIYCLQTDFRLDDFVTIEDAIDAGYPFGGGPALKDYYIEYPLIYKNWANLESSEMNHMLIKLSNGYKFVLAINYETAKMYLKNPSRQLHILPRRILNSPTAIFFKRYSWLAKSINLILIHLVESGLVDKIYRENTFIRHNDDADVSTPIDLEDFTGCYVILLLGWLIASIVFAVEKYIHSGKKIKTCLFSKH